MRILKILKQYGRFLSRIDFDAANEMPSGLFELNTSRSPHFVQWVIDGCTNKGSAVSSWVLIDSIFILRDLAKWTCISLLCGFLYKKKKNHLKLLKTTKIIFVGFVDQRKGKLYAKDYEGFRERIELKNQSLTIGLRLPRLNLFKYMRGGNDVMPVFAFVRFKDLLYGLSKQRKFQQIVQKLENLPAEMKKMCVRDIHSGHALGSFLLGTTVARLCQNTSRNAKVYFPMERHDWEQVAITKLSGLRRIEAVQNCTFSSYDLNMYRHTPGLPNFRKTIPDKINVLDSDWKRVFQEKLGFNCKISVMQKHRFSEKAILLNLNGETPRLLYLASINREKLFLDFEALTPLSRKLFIEVRLHPSLNHVALPAGFRKATDISHSYGWCVYADTSMVFQLKCKREYLLFIQHESFPNQDPTRWFSGFGSRQISASRLKDHEFPNCV